MNSKVKTQIINEAKLNSQEEVCGFIYQNQNGVFAKSCINIATDRSNTFEIDSLEYISLNEISRICGIYHSHPTGEAIFSEDDIDISKELGLPIFLYANETFQWNSFIPENYQINPIGRTWAWGEADCYETVRLHYRQKRKIFLTDYDRDESFENATESQIARYISKEGFRFLEKEEKPEIDDVLFIRTEGSIYPHHLAIIIGPNQMLHHPRHANSRIDTIDGYWLKRLVGVLRYCK